MKSGSFLKYSLINMVTFKTITKCIKYTMYVVDNIVIYLISVPRKCRKGCKNYIYLIDDVAAGKGNRQLIKVLSLAVMIRTMWTVEYVRHC